MSNSTSIEALRRRFALTPAEATVTAHLADGESVKEVAAQLGITEQTVRVHLRHIYAKTGAHRQATLVHLVLQRQWR